MTHRNDGGWLLQNIGAFVVFGPRDLPASRVRFDAVEEKGLTGAAKLSKLERFPKRTTVGGAAERKFRRAEKKA